jgi:N-acetylglutamate synthase-like GNAT family acetyltransferase
MDDVTIEIYNDQYKRSVAGLILGIQNAEFQVPITLAQQPDLDQIEKFYQSGNGNFWVAKHQGEVIGTIALLDIGNHSAALRKMFVAKAYRGKESGVGQKLLDTLIDWAKQKNITDIFLGTTEKFIAAQRFYEKNGFVEIPGQQLPNEFPVMSVDTKFYQYSLRA